MSGFTSGPHGLYAESVPLPELARLYGAPLYVYSAGAVRANYDALSNALNAALGAEGDRRRRPARSDSQKTGS